MQVLAGQKFTKVALCGLLALAFAGTVSQAQDSAAPSASATPSIAAAAGAGAIRGTIQASGVPLPGVAVTAVSPGNATKYTTTTDVDGVFQMAVPAGAHYTLSAELAGFALATKEITVASSASATSSPTVADLSMDLASRVPQSGTESATAAPSPAPGGAAVSSTAGATVSSTAGARGGSHNSVGSQAAVATRSGAAARGTVARVGRGSQTIQMENNLDAGQLDASVGQANSGVEMPTLGGLNGDENASSLGSDTVAVSGQQGQTNALAGFSEGDIRQRIDDMRREGAGNGDIAGALMGAMAGGGLGGPGEPGEMGGRGGRGGPGGGGGGGGRGGGFGGGGGGFGRAFHQNSNAWHGSLAYNGSDSALNATPFSVTGRPVAKPASDTNSLVASVAGSPFIPGLTKPNPKQFVFLTVNETRNTVPTISQAVVPTAVQRLGDLTGQGNVYDPSTGQPYGASGCSPALLAINAAPTACIPDNELDPAAKALLNYYPFPNIVPIGTNDNFQTVTTSRRHSSQVSARYNRSFGAQPQRGRFGGFGGGGFGRGGGNGQNRNAPPTLRQSIAANFAYSHQAASTQSFVPALGGNTESNGYNVSGSYTVGYGRLNSTATVGWNRSSSLGANYFTNGLINPATEAGIDVANPIIYNNPFYFGVPSVGLTGFSGLGEATTPSNTINQTITASDSVAWSHKRHNMRFGLDFHRIHLDSIGGTNVLGSFTFSGFATESPTEQTCNGCTPTTGSSLADLLIGHPQQTQITAGLNKIYLRGNAWDWYAQDDWRARSNLTLLYAVRWEYFSPYSEKNGRLVNLALSGSGNGLQIQNVCATAAAGCELVSSGTLVAPDKAMYSPRIGLAWSPKSRFTKNTVVRAGYGINYNTGQYATFARKLAFQQPFAVTQTNTLASGANPNTGCTLANMTLANGFNCSAQVVQSNYGVDPNYRLGMVQIYNLGIQRTLPQGIVLNIDYNGSYAGNLDMLRAPNRTPTGVLNQAVTQFTYEDSLGYQRSNGLAINLRQRMHKGIALGATYTYSHSIDDASSIGGSGNSIAQDDQHLDREESNSSFDRRHVLSGNYVIELPFGPNRALLNKGGVWSHVLDGFSASGNFTFASGSWATPVYSGTANEVASGSGASLRPNRVAGQPIAGAGTLRSWFNKNAFTTPVDANGNITYGNAGRNSIEMPGTVSANGSLSRTFSFGETRSLETRITASNVFNTVQYSTVDTTLNSPTFGQVVGVQGMRAFTYTARYRF